ncbi:MAG: choline-sulfatase, partial [Marmoricola sp.]
GEYMGEGAIAPIVMIRRGDLKFVHSPVDPDQLYDLVLDPQERVNLAEDPDWSATLKELRDEVDRRWDLDALHQDVVEDQARRRLLNTALRKGHVTPWEYTPPQDGGSLYMRNHLDLNAVEHLSRFPAVTQE